MKGGQRKTRASSRLLNNSTTNGHYAGRGRKNCEQDRCIVFAFACLMRCPVFKQWLNLSKISNGRNATSYRSKQSSQTPDKMCSALRKQNKRNKKASKQTNKDTRPTEQTMLHYKVISTAGSSSQQQQLSQYSYH